MLSAQNEIFIIFILNLFLKKYSEELFSSQQDLNRNVKRKEENYNIEIHYKLKYS